jgi:membrane protease YdiL (CAAX protease family)
MKKNAILKCLFVIFLIIIPNIFISLTVFQNEEHNVFFSFYNFNLGISSALAWLIKSLQWGVTLLLLMYLTKESFSDFGFNKITIKELCKSLLRLLGLTILFLIILSIIITITLVLFKGLGGVENFDYKNIYSLSEKEKNAVSSVIINIIPIIFIAFTEELCFRSYLYKNLTKIIDNKWICIVIVNILFGIGHIYQGIFAIFSTFIIGFIFSIEFKKYNNIYSISIFHALRNIIIFFIRAIV